jgi:DNA-binding PadR family transcriptional regulator
METRVRRPLVPALTELPLTPLTMAILLALAEGEKHGYALMKDVERQTGGMLAPGTGSLYAALDRLEGEGYIEESQMRPARDEDQRRKYFRITAEGRGLARAEAARMQQVVEMARARSLIPGTASPRSAR